MKVNENPQSAQCVLCTYVFRGLEKHGATIYLNVNDENDLYIFFDISSGFEVSADK